MNDTTTAAIIEGEGYVGYLTWDQWERFTRAFQTARTHLHWWRIAGHIRSGDPDEHKTRSSEPQLVLPATWLAADEISRLIGILNDWPELEDAANDVDGCELALLFTREVETAHAKWPMADRPHKVKFIRCRHCQQKTLKYYPPRLSGPVAAPRVAVVVREGERSVSADVLDVNVKCTNCGEPESPEMFARDALLIEMEHRNGKTMGVGEGSGAVDEQDGQDDLRVVADGTD